MPFRLPQRRPAVMGILNVTPNSFSDGGRHPGPEEAYAFGSKLMEQGADLIDVGGESTRPGAEPVTEEEELRRVIPVVTSLTRAGIPVSIDTMKPEVARQALDVGAVVVNDVRGLRDPAMREVCAQSDCTVCIMHMQGDPKTMQDEPSYLFGVVDEVSMWLRSAVDAAVEAGVWPERIWIDPGIGFGKTSEHNLELLHDLGKIVSLGFPVMIGVSRKGFIGRLLGPEGAPLPTEDRLEGTLAAQTVAQWKGARILRAHDVLQTRRAVEMTAAILRA